MILKFIKLCFISGLLAVGTIFPIVTAFIYANPWSEAISIAEDKYPDSFWIPTAYSSSTYNNGSKTMTYKSMDIVLVPANKTFSFGKKNNEKIEHVEQEGGLIGFIVGTAILYSLYFWLLPRTIANIKIWMKGKSRYV